MSELKPARAYLSLFVTRSKVQDVIPMKVCMGDSANGPDFPQVDIVDMEHVVPFSPWHFAPMAIAVNGFVVVHKESLRRALHREVDRILDATWKEE